MTCAGQTWIGAYVLDALEPEETEQVRAHLASCPSCQDEVVRLSWIPALLRTVSFEEIDQLGDRAAAERNVTSPGPDRLLASVHTARRTRRRRRTAAVATGLVAAATIAGASAVATGQLGDTGQRPPVAVRTVDPHSHVHAAVALRQHPWGTEVHLTLRGVTPGEHCSMLARSRDGRAAVVATWVATYRGSADISTSTAIPVGQLGEVDVLTSDGRRLAKLVVPAQNR